MWFEQSDLSAADASIEIMMSVGDERFSSLEGKSVVTFGDSITWYDNRNYLNGKAEGDLVFGYQHYMRKAGITTNNQGANGYESKRILNIVRSFTRFAQMDYMTLMTGANDERLYVNVGVVLPIGSTYDTNTYAGALQTIIEYALSINPRLKIVLFTPIKGWFYGDDPRMIRDDYVDAVKAIGKIYSIPVLDLHNLIGLNNLTRDIMINDPEPPENELYSLHPSNYGYERMASVILPFLADV
jgi:lysophospholipase L1-like esterase